MELEELERKKRELELRSEIARLERKERVAAKVSKFDLGLLWVWPLAFCIAFGLFGLVYAAVPLPTMSEASAAVIYLLLTPAVVLVIQRLRRRRR